jgi:transposase
MRCPGCGFGKAWKLGDGRRKCKACGIRYTPQRTVWDGYRIPEAAKRELVKLFVLGVPAYRARHVLPCGRRTAERFFRDIRHLLAAEELQSPPLEGTLELDEALFGGRFPGKRGWGAGHKVCVFGIYKRNGKVRVTVIPDRKHATLRALIQSQTTPGSLFFTDDYHAYAGLSVRGDHVTVRKTRGKPAGRDHVNGIEGFWSYAKHWLYGYRGVSQKLFPDYLGEISYRYNHRDRDLTPAITGLLQKTRREKRTS